MRTSTVSRWAIVVCSCLAASPASCAVVTYGNLLAAYGNRIYEVTTAGNVVQSFQVPELSPGSSRKLGDLVYDPAGKIHVRINGPWSGACCSSLLSTFDIATETWVHTAVSIYNAGGYNLELAKRGGALYTEWNQLSLNTRESVNVRPDMHFTHPDERADNLTLGRDGYFYATSNFNPANLIHQIDPITYERIGTGLSTANSVDRSVNVHGIAVRENGDYFAVGFEGAIYSFTATQQFVRSSAAIGRGPGDLSLSREGVLAFGQSRVGQTAGTLTFFDTQLAVLGQVTFQSSSSTDGLYTSFIEVPEAGSLTYLASLLASAVFSSRRRNHPRRPTS